MVQVDLFRALFAFLNLVHKGSTDEKIPDHGLVDFLELFQDLVSMFSDLLGLVLVQMNERVGLSSDHLDVNDLSAFIDGCTISWIAISAPSTWLVRFYGFDAESGNSSLFGDLLVVDG